MSEVSMSQSGEGGQGGGRRHRRGRDRRRGTVRPRVEPTGPRWSKESGPKTCRKCGGRMYPADWIWQQYGLCLGWRCSQCKEKVLARSLPFKGLRKRRPDPDELRDRAEAASPTPGANGSPPRAGVTGRAGGGGAPRNDGRRGAV